jgi:hypothetical protein
MAAKIYNRGQFDDEILHPLHDLKTNKPLSGFPKIIMDLRQMKGA